MQQCFKVTVDLQGTIFFAIFLYHAKLNITNLTTFSQKNDLKILKCARVIHKNVFSNKILLPASVISQLERVKGRDTRDVFRGNLKRGLGFQDAFLIFLLFTLASCDKFYHNKSYARFPPFCGVFDPPKKERRDARLFYFSYTF